jgi:fucose 4-O-acetylase-like acetyltransferase
MTSRIAWIDVAKGIGICLVVFGHVERGLSAANILEDRAWPAVDFYLYSFHMPLFMFIAGFNAPGSRDKAGFVKRKLLSIAYPYIVWSLIQGSLEVMLARYTNNSASWRDVAFILWQPISPFWFLYVLFFFMVIAALIRPSMNMLVVSLFMMVASPWVTQYALFNIFYFYFYFIGGYLLSGKISRISNALAFASLCVFVVWTTFVYKYAPIIDSPIVLPSAATGIVLVLWVSQRLAHSLVLAYLGACSLAIYVMHILAAAGARIILKYLIDTNSQLLHLTAGMIAGIMGPLLLYEGMRRANISKYFGLPTVRYTKNSHLKCADPAI